MKKLLCLAFLAAALAHPSAGHAALCNEGDSAQVLWKGSWYPATVLKAKPDSCYIHYKGYKDSWDEWVGPDRYRKSSSKE